MAPKRFLLVIFVLSLSPILYAQTLDWAYKIGGSYEDNAYDITKDQMGNIYLAGGFCNVVNFNPKGVSVSKSANGVNSSDNFFAKYDKDFNLKWVIPIGTPSWEAGVKIAVDTLLNVFVLGEAYGTIDLDPSSNVFSLNCSPSNLFIAKYDSMGNFINASTVPSIGTNPPNEKVFIDRSGNVFAYSNDTLSKYDNNVNLLWAKSILGQPEMDSKGNFYAIANFYGPFYPTSWSQNVLTFIMYNENGNTVFTKQYAHSSDFINGGFIKRIQNKATIISGKFWGTLSFYDNNDTISVTNSEMGLDRYGNQYKIDHEFIAEFDTSHNIMWAKSYAGSSPQAYIIEPDKNGNIYTLGFLNFSANFDPDGNTIVTNGGYGNYIAKYDSSFRITAVSKFLGGSYNDFIGSFKIYDDTAVMCGHFFNTIDLDLSQSTYNLSASPPEDIFVAKYSTFNITSPSLSIEENKKQSPTFIAYPNPSNGIFSLELEKITTSSFISVFNIHGKEILSKRIDNNILTIDLSDNAPGMYYAVLVQGLEKSSVKLVKTE